MESGPQAPTRADEGQLRAKIDSLIKDEQVPHLDDPKARSELLRRTLVSNIWPAVENDYKRMMEELKKLLEERLTNEGIHATIFARVKEAESIKKSLQRRDDHLFNEKGKRFESLDEALRHVHDLVGLRVVLTLVDQLTEAKELIERTFFRQGDPTYFSPDREVGQKWKKFVFGAYETHNYRLSHPDGQYRDVIFEVQLTNVGGHLFNMLAHPLLYKRAWSLSKHDEMVLDHMHGQAKSFGLCVHQIFEDRLRPSFQTQGIEGNGSVPRDLVSKIIRDTEKILSRAVKGAEGGKTPAATGSQGGAEEQLSKLLDQIRIAVDEAKHSPCHNIPPSRAKHFVGRKDELARLQQKFFIQKEWQQAAIFGLGGVGKTQVALQLAHWVKKHRPEYSIFWVPALSRATFEQAYNEMARLLRLENAGTGGGPMHSVRRHLSSEAAGPWLLIVDNADDADLLFGSSDAPSGLDEYLPESEDGLILFTTRLREVAVSVAGSDVVELSEMDPQEAAEQFEKLSTRKHLLRDEESMKLLLGELAYLPLAITQAASYLSRNAQLSIAEYLELLRKTEQDAASLMSREFRDNTRHRGSRNAVATTWLVSFEQIRKSDHAAADLLSFLSNIEPKAVPLSILPRPKVEEHMVHAIGTLCGYAFLTQRGDSKVFDMHSLVHLATRIWIQKEGRTAATREKATRHLAEIFPTDDWANRTLWREYLPHVFKALQGGEAVNTKEEAGLCYWAGRCLRVDGRIKEAVKYLEKDSQWKSGHFAKDHPSRLASQHELAVAYGANGQITKAVALLEQVVAVRNETLAENHPSRLASQHELAGAYKQNGQIIKAVALLEQVVAVRNETLAENHPSRLASQHQLAGAYQANGQIIKAVALLEQVVAIEAKTLAENHPDRLASQHALAVAYQANGQITKAVALLEQVVAIRNETLAKNHPSRLVSQHQLAGAYRANGQIIKAVALLEQVVAIKAETLAENHPSRLASQHELAIAYQANGQITKAVALLEQVVAIEAETLTKNHPSRLASQHELAGAYEANGQITKAVALLEQVVAIKAKTFAENHPSRLVSEELLAYVLSRLKGGGGGT